MSYSVYIHTNMVNGMKYVGVTRKNPEKRWAKGVGYIDNSHFYRAIKKYGWDNFDHFIIEVDTEEKMFELEKQLIEYYQTTDPEKGYNKSKGGEGGCYKGVNSGSKEYYRERYKEDKEKYKKRVMDYYNENKDKINTKRRFKRSFKKYKEITPIKPLW